MLQPVMLEMTMVLCDDRDDCFVLGLSLQTCRMASGGLVDNFQTLAVSYHLCTPHSTPVFQVSSRVLNARSMEGVYGKV